MKRTNPIPRLIWGAAVLALGLILWLDRMHKVRAGDILQWWSVFLIAFGLAHLVERRWFAAAVMILFGLAFLPSVPHLYVRQVLALTPLVITIGGVTLVMQALRPPIKGATTFQAVAVMGGSGRTVGGNDVVSGDAIAVMGGCEITIAPGTREAVVDVLAFWGGIEIRVPRGWTVESHVTPILGAFVDNTVATEASGASRLVVRGSVIMGAVDVKHSREET
jgi:cell wall-active antibiotic response 4TMS protein YvqF